jgi:hypothetical protein
MVRRTRQGVTGVAGAIAAALLLVACGTGPASSAEVRNSCAFPTTGATLEPFPGLVYDYDPSRSPDELARKSELIVSGTISAIGAGRTMVYPAGSAGTDGPTSLVLVISAVTAVRGQQQAGNDGNVYLELHGMHADPASYSRALPAGARVVAYLVPASDGAPDARTDVAVANPAAGRPAGQALYLPAGPQGLALQAAEGNVVWPLIGAHAPGCLADALPGGHLIGQ